MFTSFSVDEKVLDLLYPPTCVRCEADGDWLCAHCLADIRFTSELSDPVIALGAYANPTLRLLLTHLKYRSAYCLRSTLIELIRRFRSSYDLPWPWAKETTLILCAIPSDQKRVRMRGMDHIKILTEIIHKELVPWAETRLLLERTRHIVQNASLPANTLREANIKNVFKATESIQGAVLLIDDIYTTGATWNEAARVLEAAGATKIYGFVFARKI